MYNDPRLKECGYGVCFCPTGEGHQRPLELIMWEWGQYEKEKLRRLLLAGRLGAAWWTGVRLGWW